MTTILEKLVFALTAACALAGPAAALAANVDEDLRQAAKLQRQGEAQAAIAIWTRWAEKGNVDAAYNLAVVHQHGDGVDIDYGKAMHWYRFAAERDDRASQYMLGQMFLDGQGVPADKEAAHRWFTGHRAHHMHHEHAPQMQAWRKQAAALIQERDRHESLAASRENADQVMADLRRRAGLDAAPRLVDASTVRAGTRRP